MPKQNQSVRFIRRGGVDETEQLLFAFLHSECVRVRYSLLNARKLSRCACWRTFCSRNAFEKLMDFIHTFRMTKNTTFSTKKINNHSKNNKAWHWLSQKTISCVRAKDKIEQSCPPPPPRSPVEMLTTSTLTQSQSAATSFGKVEKVWGVLACTLRFWFSNDLSCSFSFKAVCAVMFEQLA